MKRLFATFCCALALLWGGEAVAITTANIGVLTSNAGTATSLAIPVSNTTTAGQAIIVVLTFGANVSAITVADNANGANCSGSYTQNSSVHETLYFYVFSCPVASTQMTSGGNCGSGSSACTITASWTTGSKVSGVAFNASGLATSGMFDKAGTAATGSATSGTPISTGPTSPSLTTSSELIIGTISVQAGTTTATTFGTLTNGYAAISTAAPTGSGGAGQWTSGQAVTSGAYQLNGTFNASVTWYGETWLFKAAGSSVAACSIATTGAGPC